MHTCTNQQCPTCTAQLDQQIAQLNTELDILINTYINMRTTTFPRMPAIAALAQAIQDIGEKSENTNTAVSQRLAFALARIGDAIITANKKKTVTDN